MLSWSQAKLVKELTLSNSIEKRVPKIVCPRILQRGMESYNGALRIYGHEVGRGGGRYCSITNKYVEFAHTFRYNPLTPPGCATGIEINLIETIQK